ncbi:MAG: 6-bladed beta-propeller, partial [bacterium]
MQYKYLALAILITLFQSNAYSLDLTNPYGIATNGNYLYIADTGNCRILRCNLDGSNPLTFGNLGKGAGEFMHPQGIGVTPAGDIYVVDTGNHRIQKLKDNGTSITFVKTIGSEGQSPDQFLLPRDIAIDFKKKYFLVCDSANQRISKFDLDGNPINSFSNGNSFGEWGTQSGMLWHSYGIDLDNDGNIYVADTYNHRIQKFSPDGKATLNFGGMGQGEGQFIMPADVVVDKEGYILVIDTENHRVQKFSPKGIYIELYGKYGIEKGNLFLPQKGVISIENKLYVIDSTLSRFEVFNISTYITDVSASPMLFSPNSDGKFDTTTISYTIPETAHVTINIYDKDGNLVRNLVNEDRPAGTQTKVWDGKDDSDKVVADGEYTYVINAVNALNYHAPQKKGNVWIDNSPPEITNQKATPDIVIVGNTVTLTAQITDVNGIASATINLMPILNNSNQPMFDDGTYGDEIANDGVYSYKTTIPNSVLCGVKSLIIRAE